jgi:hypothetical protein
MHSLFGGSFGLVSLPQDNILRSTAFKQINFIPRYTLSAATFLAKLVRNVADNIIVEFLFKKVIAVLHRDENDQTDERIRPCPATFISLSASKSNSPDDQHKLA